MKYNKFVCIEFIFFMLFTIHLQAIPMGELNPRELDEMGFSTAHVNGFKGKDIAVAIIESGMNHNHPFFINPNQIVRDVADTSSDFHGTGVASILLDAAPEIKLIFINVDRLDDEEYINSTFETLQTHMVRIFNVSLGYNKLLHYEKFISRFKDYLRVKDAGIVFAGGNDPITISYHDFLDKVGDRLLGMHDDMRADTLVSNEEMLERSIIAINIAHSNDNPYVNKFFYKLIKNNLQNKTTYHNI